METVTVTLPADMAPIAAPLLLGYLFNWGLFGALTLQVYIYHTSSNEDRIMMKLLVYGVYTIETIQTILITHDAFEGYARGFGNLAALDSAHYEWLAVPIMSGIVSCVVQLFYAYRVWLLSRSLWLVGLIAGVSLMQGIAAIVEGAQARVIGTFSGLADKTAVACGFWLAGSAISDVMIAACMTYFLLASGGRLVTSSTLIVRLVYLVVETGMFTAIAALIDLILFYGYPQRAYHGTVALTLAKLYSNALLVVFNNRAAVARSSGIGRRQITTIDKTMDVRDAMGDAEYAYGNPHSPRRPTPTSHSYPPPYAQSLASVPPLDRAPSQRSAGGAPLSRAPSIAHSTAPSTVYHGSNNGGYVMSYSPTSEHGHNLAFVAPSTPQSAGFSPSPGSPGFAPLPTSPSAAEYDMGPISPSFRPDLHVETYQPNPVRTYKPSLSRHF